MPFISSINKNIWACYVSPHKDELFTSWYMRICQSHMVKSHSFGKYYFENQNFWNRDIDNNPTNELTRIIFKNTPLKQKNIKNLFLTSYQNYLFENHNPTGFTSGILPLGIHHRKRKHKGLLYCPVCLSKKAYYKKQWRLIISYICCECGVLLKDSCPKCDNPVCFHRLEQGNKSRVLTQPLSNCFNCNYDLTANPVVAKAEQILFQQKIYQTLHRGYSEIHHYSFSYFNLLLNISNLISRKNLIWGRLRTACEVEFGLLPENNCNFNTWNINDRLPIIECAYKILKNPDFLKYLIIKYNLRLSEFNRDRIVPYSFEKNFKEI